MFVIETIPLTSLPLSAPQVLTYYSATPINKGGLLTVPLRNRKVKAVCLNCTPLKDRKGQIKDQRFKLSSVEQILTEQSLLTSQQIKLAFWLYHFYLAPLGQCFRLFLPKSYLNRRKPFEASEISPSDSNIDQEPTLIWGPNRTSKYKEYIARSKGQVLILSPELGSISTLRASLGLSKAVVYHSRLSTSLELETWNQVRDQEVKVVFGTRSASFLPFSNLGLIIMDREQSQSYVSWNQHPRYHTKQVTEQLSQLFGAKLVLGANNPSLSTYSDTKNNLVVETTEPVIGDTKTEIINMKNEIEKKNYSMISDRAKELLLKTLNNNQSALVFVKRMGLATSVLCRDCGHIITCPQCQVPMVLHKEHLLCHHCGHQATPPEDCPQCHGLRIKHAGLGVQKIASELRSILETQTKVLSLSSHQTPKEEQQRATLQLFKERKGVLVGTSLMLKNGLRHLLPPVSLGIVISADSLISFPDYHSREQAFRIIKELESTSDTLLIQTFSPKLELWSMLPKGSTEFLDDELKKRRALSYPPVTEIVRLSYSHKDKGSVQEETKKLKNFLSKVIDKSNLQNSVSLLGPAPSLVPESQGVYTEHLILKIKKNNKQIKEFLRQNLPRNWEVDINPLSLLS